MDSESVIARADHLVTQMMELNGVGGSTAEGKCTQSPPQLDFQ